MTIPSLIAELKEQYKEASVNTVKDFCDIAGVDYRNPDEVDLLQKELYQRGYKMRIEKIKEPKVEIGQNIYLLDLEDNIVVGSKIVIDLTVYEVRVFDIPKGTVH